MFDMILVKTVTVPCTHLQAPHPNGDSITVPCTHLQAPHPNGDTVTVPCIHRTVRHPKGHMKFGIKIPCTHVKVTHPKGHTTVVPCTHKPVPQHPKGHVISSSKKPSQKPLVINVGSKNWQKNAMNAITGNRALIIKINPRSNIGREIIRVIRQTVNQGKAKMKIHHSAIAAVIIMAIAAFVAVTAIFAASTVATIAILAAVLMFAIHNRCDVPQFTFNTNYDTDTTNDSDVQLNAGNITGISISIENCRGPQ